MNDTQARARVWTLCLAALVLAALTGPLAVLLTPLAHASVTALNIVAAALAAALVAPMWPSPSCSPAPSCASCGLVWTATVSPPGSATAPPGVVRRAHPGASDRGAILVRRGLQRAADRGTIGPRNVVPSVALAPKAWSYDRATIHTGKWGFSATMELLFILGWVLPVALVPAVL